MSHHLFQHFNNIFFYISFIYFVSFIYEQPLLVHCMVIEFLYYLHHQVYILYFHYFNMAVHWATIKYHFQYLNRRSVEFVLKVIHSLKFVDHQVSY